MKTISFLIFLCGATLFISCESWHSKERKRAEISKFGSDMTNQQCRPFKLSSSQVVKFFNKAVEISPKQESEEYGWVPCFAEGYLYEGKLKRRFKLRPTGVAQIESPEVADKVLLFGCKECAPWFK